MSGVYFDGDTDGAAWEGDPGESTSALLLPSLEPAPEPDPEPGDLQSAIDAADRTPIARVTVDWDRDGTWDHPLSDLTPWVTEVTVNREATGDLPPEASLVEGSIAATCTITLGGVNPDTGEETTGVDGLSAVAVFAPYREDSPLWGVAPLGAPIRVDVGLLTDTGPQLRRQLTGQVRSLAPRSSDRTVTLAAIDGADLLRAPITLPTHAINYSDLVGSNHKLGINSQAVIDYILRRNGYHASPPAIPGAQISCTGHGWLAAEAGRSAVPRGVAAVIPDASWFIDDGPFGMMAVRGVWDGNNLYQEFFAREPYEPTVGNGIGIGMWVRAGNDMGVTGSHTLVHLMPLVDHEAWQFRMYLTSTGGLGGQIVIGGVTSGFVQPIATPTAWMYVGVHFQHMPNGQTRIRYRQNGATTQGEVTTPGMASTVAARLQATAWTFRDWSNLQVWYDYDPPPGAWPGEVHTPTASVDKGANWLLHLPDVVEQDSLTVLKEVVGAEFGTFGFLGDDYDVPTFRSRSAANDPTTVDKTITADRALLDLATEINVDTVRNSVSTETVMGFCRWPRVIIESKDILDWQTPVGVWEYDVPLAWGAVPTTTQTIPRVASASWSDDYTWGYVSVQAANPTVEITSGITVTATAVASRMVRLTVRNYSASPVRFATTSGSPALRVAGWLIELDPAQIARVEAPGSVAVYGDRAYKIDPNPWRQYPPSLADVAGGLLATLSDPVPVIPNVPTVGDPTLRIGDCVRFVEPQGQGSFRAYILGHRLSLTTSDGLQSELTVRPVAPPGLGILDDDELGILDDTLILAP